MIICFDRVFIAKCSMYDQKDDEINCEHLHELSIDIFFVNIFI